MSEQEKNTKPIPVYFTKDNNLISSKSQMTIYGRKTFDAAIMNISEGKDKYGDTEIFAEISGQELRKFIGSNSGSLYTRVKQLVDPKGATDKEGRPLPSLLDWRIIIYDDKKKTIIAKNIITDAEFKKGKLRIVFNKVFKDNLIGYQGNYTMLDRTIISKFKSNYAYQLYQIFKKTIDKETYNTKTKGPFQLQMDLVDLKVQLGVISANADDILYEAVTNDNVVTFDAIEDIKDKAFVKKCREFGLFKRNAIMVAQKEINELSDISVECEDMTRGQGGKGVGFIFTIQYKDIADVINTPAEEKKDVDIFDFIDQMREFMPDEFGTKDLKAIAEAAGYDLDMIRAKYKLYSVQSGITNPSGWMIDAIRKDYKSPKKSAKRLKGFEGFEGKQYDFEQLEMQLLDN